MKINNTNIGGLAATALALLSGCASMNSSTSKPQTPHPTTKTAVTSKAAIDKVAEEPAGQAPSSAKATMGRQDRPNVILIFMDDQGYADLSCYGSKTINTPNIDTLAKDGKRFTSFVVAAAICTPSRAGLLTGCYPRRINMHRGVLFPKSDKGLSPDEHTIADYLKAQGYATACIGKWHLGHHKETLPTSNGFDYYYGIPYSNDMSHPDFKRPAKKPSDGKKTPANGQVVKKTTRAEKMDVYWKDPKSTLTSWGAPLMENETIIEMPCDQRTITRRYTQKAIDFIKTNTRSTGSGQASKPFFIYLAHSMPHVPLYVPDDSYDPDPKKAYIKVIEHLDAEVGRLLKTLDDLDLSRKTYVIYTSDNGPWLPYGHHAGSAGPFRDGKMKSFEGGHRVPCLIRGPGIPAGTTSDELTTAIDILPTLAEIVGKPLPKDKTIDGISMLGLWNGTAKKSPRNEFVYYRPFGPLEGIRQGKWKYAVRPRKQSWKDRKAGKPAPAPAPEVTLYDLSKDLGETTNLAEANPELVKKLQARMTELDAEIAENSRPCWMTAEARAKAEAKEKSKGKQ